MRLSALTPLRQFVKVLAVDCRHETKTTLLLVSQAASTPEHKIPFLNENWRPNVHGIMVGGEQVEGVLDIARQIGERSGFSLSLPFFDQDREGLMAKRRLFEANGVGTFYAWEEDDSSRINIADVKRGQLLYGPDESLENPHVNWDGHGLVLVAHEEEPRYLSLHLSLRLG